MNYKHFTTDERSKIDILNKEGYSARKIAVILNKHHSSISRELNRNSFGEIYNSVEAVYKSKLNKQKCGRNTKLNLKLRRI